MKKVIGDQSISQLGNQEEPPGKAARTGSPLPSPWKGEGEEEGGLRANVPVELFTMGRWGEFPQWKCSLCPWDTLEGEAAMMEHWQATHAPAPEPTKVSLIARADRFGNEVK